MAGKELRPIWIESGEAVNEGRLHVIVYDRGERLLRAARIWGLCWLGGVISAFVPALHFVLTPGFLLAGPIWAYARYKAMVSLDRVTGRCPSHQGEIELVLQGENNLPPWAYCPACNAPLRLVEKS